MPGARSQVQFTPHLLPMNRGILATVYVKGDAKIVHQTLEKAYENEPFLRVLPFGALPSTRDIAGSNFCHLGVIGDRKPGRAVVVAVLDNLTKGSLGPGDPEREPDAGDRRDGRTDAGPGVSLTRWMPG